MESKQELWLTNLSKADVSLSDLGVKVPIGKTVNVYKVNPYLTVQQVEKSKRDGALFKRLSGTNPTLRIVKKDTRARPAVLDQLKQSKEAVKIKKTKSSVVIENIQEENEDGEKFDFADYGVSASPDASQVREQASVFVKAKEDKPAVKQSSDVVTKPKVDTGVSKQSAVVMDTMVKNLTNPVGPLADMVTKGNDPFVVAKPPAPTKEPVTKPKQRTKVAKETGAVMVDAVKEVKETTKKFNTVKRSNASPDDAIMVEKTKFDAKVATKTDAGAVIMELKEVPKTEQVKAKPSKKK